MTPSELHSRILLHELRTILLDPTREGTQIPEAWKTLLQSDPHNPANYLVLADELDEQGDELGELCRIQVELIGLLPVDWVTPTPGRSHPFRWDWAEWATNDGDKTKRSTLLEMRMLLTETLYEEKEVPTILDENLLPRLQSRPLGRTTRMLTDILRYCALNDRRNALVLGIDARHAELLFRTTHELCDHLGVPCGLLITRPARERRYLGVYDCKVQFAGDEERVYARPNITFTDHACQPNYQMHPIQREFHQPSTQLGKTLARNAITNALINHNTPINPPNGN